MIQKDFDIVGMATNASARYHVFSDNAQLVNNLTVLVNDSAVPLVHQDDNLLSDIVGIWITGFCCLLGLAGNILSFLVLQRAHRQSPMFCVLRAVAFSDGLFLLTVFIIQTIVNMYPITGILEWCFIYRGYIQFAIWPLLMMTQMSTVWLTVLVSLERFIAICFPFKSAALCTMSQVRKSVIFIYSISILFNIPRYFEHEVLDNSFMIKSKMGSHEIYRYLYTCTLYSLMVFFVPLLLLIFFNLKLVMALQKGKKQWASLQFRQKKEQNLTIIPLTIVVVFFICGTPALVVNVIDAMNPRMLDSTSFLVFMVVANLLVVLNSACNFIIYCLLGKKFRSKLVDMFSCNCTSYRSVGTTTIVNSQVSDL